MKKKDILSGSDNFELWLKSINSKRIKLSESKYPASSSAFIFNTPCFSGELTTEYNLFYSNIVRTDRLNEKQKKQYSKLESKYKMSGKFFSFYDFIYALYDELKI